MAKARAAFDKNSGDFARLESQLRTVGSTEAQFDVFAADLARAQARLDEQELLRLAVTACDYGKAGHAFLLLNAGVKADVLNVYMMRILPDDLGAFQRLRRDAFNSATGNVAFDKIMQRQGRDQAAMDMARTMDYLTKYPERYLTMTQMTTSRYNPPTL